MKDFNIDNLEKKNIYKTPEHLFENIQNNVMAKIEMQKPAVEEAKVFKINWKWGYAVAAALAMVFGMTFFMNDKESVEPQNIAGNKVETPKSESQITYETFVSDVHSVENPSTTSTKVQTIAQTTPSKKEENTAIKSNIKANSKNEELQMNEFLDALSTTEIGELAKNSTQDVYLDLYN